MISFISCNKLPWLISSTQRKGSSLSHTLSVSLSLSLSLATGLLVRVESGEGLVGPALDQDVDTVVGKAPPFFATPMCERNCQR